jgi:hypothetical protein
LKRLSVTFPRGKVIEAVVRITVHEKKPFPEIARQG